ncbi:hypothetical protein VE03_09203 [Pseudogymnoascus sp. 23342-1-I1]|nr:hypothetical protein VE03_09203 [Pseudogymnoascus sp. 23342-1-I1]
MATILALIPRRSLWFPEKLYEIKLLEFPEMKQSAYEKINPNVRVPAIEDPNTALTLWESGAIIEHLVDAYDKKRVISFKPGTPEQLPCKAVGSIFKLQVKVHPYFGQSSNRPIRSYSEPL